MKAITSVFALISIFLLSGCAASVPVNDDIAKNYKLESRNLIKQVLATSGWDCGVGVEMYPDTQYKKSHDKELLLHIKYDFPYGMKVRGVIRQGYEWKMYFAGMRSGELRLELKKDNSLTVKTPDGKIARLVGPILEWRTYSDERGKSVKKVPVLCVSNKKEYKAWDIWLKKVREARTFEGLKSPEVKYKTTVR